MNTYLFSIVGTCEVKADTYEEGIKKAVEIAEKQNLHVEELVDTDSDEMIF